MDAFEEEERSFPPTDGDSLYRTRIMKRGWKSRNFWYFKALDNPRGSSNIFIQHIQPKFENSHRTGTIFGNVVAPYWGPDAAEVLTAQLKDKVEYDCQLRRVFEASGEETRT